MENIDLDYVILMVVKKKQEFTNIIDIKEYIPLKEKLNMLDEYIDSITIVNDVPSAFDVYFNFTMKAIKLYTNIKLDETYDEYDKLVSTGLLNMIFEYIKEDYDDLCFFRDIKFKDYMVVK